MYFAFQSRCALFIIHMACVQDDPLRAMSSWFASISRRSSRDDYLRDNILL